MGKKSEQKSKFPDVIFVSVERDGQDDYLIANADVKDMVEFSELEDGDLVGVYRLQNVQKVVKRVGLE